MGFGNTQAAQVAQQEHANRASAVEAFRYEIRKLYPNEVVPGRFLGGKGEPHTFEIHRLSRANGLNFEKLVCTKKALGKCDACLAAARPGEKRVGRAAPMAAFSFVSLRNLFLVPKPNESGGQSTTREPLHLNGEGHALYFDKNTKAYGVYPGGQDPKWGHYEVQPEGLVVWVGSLTVKAHNGDQILKKDAELQQRCMCGNVVGTYGLEKQSARVLPKGYTCSECDQPIQFDVTTMQPVYCQHCHATEIPDEVVACTASCSSPGRGGIDKCYTKIMREGEGTSTIYRFEPLPFSDWAPEHLQLLRRKDGAPREIKLTKVYAPNPEYMPQALRARGIEIPGGTQVQVPAGAPAPTGAALWGQNAPVQSGQAPAAPTGFPAQQQPGFGAPAAPGQQPQQPQQAPQAPGMPFLPLPPQK